MLIFVDHMKYFQQRLLTLLDIEIWLAGAVVLLSMLWSHLLLWALVGMGGLWLIRRWRLGIWTRRTPLDFSILILVFLLPITALVSTQPETTLLQSLRLLVGIAFFYAIVNWGQTIARLRLLLSSFLIANLGLILLAFFSVEWTTFKIPFIPPTFYERMAVLVEDTVNANVLAGSLIVLVPISLGIFFTPQKNHFSNLRWLGGLLLAGNLMILLLTQSRSALIALAVVLVIFVLLRWRRGWYLLLSGFGISGLIVLFTWPAAMRWMYQVSSGYLGIDERLEIWSRGLLIVRDFPFTGIGMGSFSTVASRLYPFFSKEPETLSHAHNLFLQIAVDLGIPGLIAWLSVVIILFWISWRLYDLGRKLGESQAQMLGLVFLASLIALSVHGLSDAVTWGMVRSAPLVWALWGTTVVSWRVLRPQNKPEKLLEPQY